MEDTRQSVVCRPNLSKVHVQVVCSSDEGKEGVPPPLSRDEAIAKAADYASEAKRLAESKGMKDYVKKAEGPLAHVG